MSLISFNSGAEEQVTGAHASSFVNLPYGNHPSQKMDVFLPANRSAKYTASLILIHGGAWSTGSRHNLSSHIDSLKKRLPDWAIFNIDYRLVNSARDFPQQVNDIKAAVDFISENSLLHQINSGKLVLLGISAGAHLGLLHAYKNQCTQIAAVVDFFGPTDLVSMYKKPWNPAIPQLMETLLHGSPSSNPIAYEHASPITFVAPHNPPTLIFHGRQDYMVDISQSELLHQKLEQAGVANKLVVYPHSGHGWSGDTLSDSFDKIKVFLKEHV